jgi:hypothetical protein
MIAMNRQDMISALKEIREYFDQRADADYSGIRICYVPNKEMALLDVVETIIENMEFTPINRL